MRRRFYTTRYRRRIGKSTLAVSVRRLRLRYFSVGCVDATRLASGTLIVQLDGSMVGRRSFGSVSANSTARRCSGLTEQGTVEPQLYAAGEEQRTNAARRRRPKTSTEEVRRTTAGRSPGHQSRLSLYGVKLVADGRGHRNAEVETPSNIACCSCHCVRSAAASLLEGGRLRVTSDRSDYKWSTPLIASMEHGQWSMGRWLCSVILSGQ